MKKINVGIIGATGYAGVELVRLLLLHPEVNLVAVSSVSYEGKKISDVYPNLKDICDFTLENEDIIDKCDVVFTSLPHGLSEKFAKKCLEKNVKLIDLGADFRLDSAEEYTKWYGKTYEHEDLHKLSVYCIPELHRQNYKNQPIIGNPGCYPTSISLALAPAIKAGLVVDNSIIIDSKSGVTGSGRGLSDTTHYPNCNEAFSPYKVASHRHTPEIEQTLSKLADKKVAVTFVPHLLPLNRGIESTVYFNTTSPLTAEKLLEIYKDFYKNEKFVRVLDDGNVANLRNVKYSNYCDISVHYDAHTQRAVIVSVIDNMVKGAAGQAIQNMNIMFNLKEDTGLDYIPPAF